MSGLTIGKALMDEMIENCRADRPNEACGILGAHNGRVVKVFRMSNASASPVRYSLDSREQFAVYRKLDQNGWELGGVYHSHTRTAAYPSPTDVRLASEAVPYVIVSLVQEPPAIRAFLIKKAAWTDETGDIEEVAVTVAG